MTSTDHAARSLNSLRLAIQLVTKAFYVVQAVCDDNVVPREDPLHSRVLLGPGILLCLCGVVNVARQAQRMMVDVVDFEPVNSSISVGAGDLGLEKVLELEGACSLPRRWVARDEDELGVSVGRWHVGCAGHSQACSSKVQYRRGGSAKY